MKNGKGSCGGEHGDMYEGEWKDNKRHGVGTTPPSLFPSLMVHRYP
jgi:hypothetical protein